MTRARDVSVVSRYSNLSPTANFKQCQRDQESRTLFETSSPTGRTKTPFTWTPSGARGPFNRKRVPSLVSVGPKVLTGARGATRHLQRGICSRVPPALRRRPVSSCLARVVLSDHPHRRRALVSPYLCQGQDGGFGKDDILHSKEGEFPI